MTKRSVFLATGGDYSDYRVYAAFSSKETAEAFVKHRDSDADRVEEHRLYDEMPGRVAWHVIEHMRSDDKVRRFTSYVWDFEGPPFNGYRRDAASYSKWVYGERAFGQDKGAVEKVWTEAHAPDEAAKAGL